MKQIHLILAATAVAALTASPTGAMPFSITDGTFAPGSGYGVDAGSAGENGGTLLDVQFSTSGFAAQLFTLNNAGDYFTFNFGTISFLETDAGNGSNEGIRMHEADHLEVMANLIFAGPIGTATISATATAIPGLTSDAAVDYLLAWDPLTVDFGEGGTFEIAMAPLSFSGIGVQHQTATITLLGLPTTGSQSVAEPATLSLLALGLLGFAATRRRKP